jgi:acetoin utilization deacetylase AcuC-like enzyme
MRQLTYTTHAHLLRPTVSDVDSRQRIIWAQQVLDGYANHVHCILPASKTELESVHSSDYVQGIHDLAAMGGGKLDPDTFLDQQLLKAAKHSAGALIDNTKAALQGAWRIALSRPGSHHAGRDYGLGSCIFNNLALGAEHAIGSGRRRVAIVDFDIHHGNGTQEIFYGRDDVATFSVHQYPHFPGTGRVDEIGIGAGTGYNHNYLLDEQMGGTMVSMILRKMTEDVLSYSPHLVLFEAGFDGHEGDWSANVAMSDSTYEILGMRIGDMLDELGCGAVFELGGGYEKASLQSGLTAFLKGLL